MKQVVTNQAAMNDYFSTRLVYAGNGRAVSYVLGETWTWDGVSECPAGPTNYDITYAREFRYDRARQRYLNRELDPTALLLGNIETLSETWSDYDGDEAYGDFSLDIGDPVELRSFGLGVGKVDPWAGSGGDSTTYYHTDRIGTTRWMSNPGGTAESPATHTAFGERISGSMTDPGDRYHYAGAWGYQSHEEFPFLHVGARYYDPATARFLQRDPIGIQGGRNVYEYAASSPLVRLDPSGLAPCPKCGHDPDLPGTKPTDPEPLTPKPEQPKPAPEDWPQNPIPKPIIDDYVPPPLRWVADCLNVASNWGKLLGKFFDEPSGPPVPGFCFVAGTLVMTAEGPKSIEDIAVRDSVVAKEDDDVSTIGKASAQVAVVVRGVSCTLVIIDLDGELLRCSPRHRFMVLDKGWTRAERLYAGDMLLTATGELVQVRCVNVQELETPVRVYNLVLHEYHSYFVGASQVLVHNGKM